MINIYSDENQSALKYPKNTEVNIYNLLIIIGDFNIRDSEWNSSYPHHSVFSDILLEVTDSFNLKLSLPVNQIPT